MAHVTHSDPPVPLQREVIRTGVWLYDGAVPMTVRVIRQNFDPQHEEEYDSDPPQERETQLTEAAAITSAEALLGIEWRTVQPPERLVSSQRRSEDCGR